MPPAVPPWVASRLGLPEGIRAWLLLAPLVGWCTWRGLDAAGALVAELRAGELSALSRSLSEGEEARLARTLEREDRRNRLPLGAHAELYRALLEHVPPSGVIWVDDERWARGFVMPALAHLVSPRVFRELAGGRGLPPAREGDAVLDVRGELRALLAAGRTAVASGPGWTLWR